MENRIIGSCELNTCCTGYGYDPQGKRVLQQTGLSAPYPTLNSVFTFYGITGQRLARMAPLTSKESEV